MNATLPKPRTTIINEAVSLYGLMCVAYRFHQAGDTTYTPTITGHTSSTTGDTIITWLSTWRGALMPVACGEFSPRRARWMAWMRKTLLC